MPRRKQSTLVVRVSDTDKSHLKKIRECGDWDNDSGAVRFCISFTKTMLSVLPAALVESMMQADDVLANGGATVDPADTAAAPVRDLADEVSGAEPDAADAADPATDPADAATAVPRQEPADGMVAKILSLRI